VGGKCDILFYVILSPSYMRQLILDVETQKIFDDVGGYYPEKLGVSFVGVIERIGFPESGPVREKRYEFFEADLPSLFPLIDQADVIVGFNVLGFDLPTLTPYSHLDIASLPVLDLLKVIKDQAGKRISLDAVAKITLGAQKSGSGLDAIKYYQTGQLQKLAAYCMKDVEITRDLYDYGRTHHHIKYLNHWNNPVALPIDFSFTPPTKSGTQLSLI
jgi:DEAD/DEAH box helicase domain-containing protein